MPTIIGIAGSLRKNSYNAAMLRAAVGLAPAGLTIEIGSIAGIPLYDADSEQEQGVPAEVRELKQRISAADGLLLATPEYNNSIPGVFKNAIDWLSRPASDIPRVFGGKAVALLGATPGRGGTRLAQAAWLPVLRTLGTRHWSGKQLYLSEAAKIFDEEGGIADAEVKKLLQGYLQAFADFLRS